MTFVATAKMTFIFTDVVTTVEQFSTDLGTRIWRQCAIYNIVGFATMTWDHVLFFTGRAFSSMAISLTFMVMAV
jgi:hypothetical protein